MLINHINSSFGLFVDSLTKTRPQLSLYITKSHPKQKRLEKEYNLASPNKHRSHNDVSKSIGKQIPQAYLLVTVTILSKYFLTNNCQKPCLMSCNILMKQIGPFHKEQHESRPSFINHCNLQNAITRNTSKHIVPPQGALTASHIENMTLLSLSNGGFFSKYLANPMESIEANFEHFIGCVQLQTLFISFLQVIKNWVLRSCGKFVKH